MNNKYISELIKRNKHGKLINLVRKNIHKWSVNDFHYIIQKVHNHGHIKIVKTIVSIMENFNINIDNYNDIVPPLIKKSNYEFIYNWIKQDVTYGILRHRNNIINDLSSLKYLLDYVYGSQKYDMIIKCDWEGNVTPVYDYFKSMNYEMMDYVLSRKIIMLTGAVYEPIFAGKYRRNVFWKYVLENDLVDIYSYMSPYSHDIINDDSFIKINDDEIPFVNYICSNDIYSKFKHIFSGHSKLHDKLNFNHLIIGMSNDHKDVIEYMLERDIGKDNIENIFKVALINNAIDIVDIFFDNDRYHDLNLHKAFNKHNHNILFDDIVPNSLFVELLFNDKYRQYVDPSRLIISYAKLCVKKPYNVFYKDLKMLFSNKVFNLYPQLLSELDFGKLILDTIEETDTIAKYVFGRNMRSLCDNFSYYDSDGVHIIVKTIMSKINKINLGEYKPNIKKGINVYDINSIFFSNVAMRFYTDMITESNKDDIITNLEKLIDETDSELMKSEIRLILDKLLI